MMCPSTGRHGFTLIEVLISIIIFTLTLTILYSGLFVSNKTWLANLRQTDDNDSKRLVVSFLQRTISQTVPIIRHEKDEKLLVFAGDEDSLQFVSHLPSHRGGGGLYRILVDADKDLRIYYRDLARPLEGSIREEREQLDSVDLLKGVTKLEFEYYGSKSPGEDPEWHADWMEQAHLPQRLRIAISLPADKKPWPEIIVPFWTPHDGGLRQMTINSKDKELSL